MTQSTTALEEMCHQETAHVDVTSLGPVRREFLKRQSGQISTFTFPFFGALTEYPFRLYDVKITFLLRHSKVFIVEGYNVFAGWMTPKLSFGLNCAKRDSLRRLSKRWTSWCIEDSMSITPFSMVLSKNA